MSNIWARPHVIQAAAPVGHGPVAGAIAPPCVKALRRGHEFAAQVDPIIGRLQARQQLAFYGRVADDVQKLLMAPYIAFQRRDIEVADQNGGLVELRGPSDHSLQEIDLLPEFGILSPVRNLATRRNINVFKRSEEHTSELQSLMRISYAVFCL